MKTIQHTKNDYEVLGLSPGAQPDEIKRAYFKLVRKYSPERDPEQFQAIREAYERLKDGGQEAGGSSFTLEFPDAPLAHQMADQIERLMKLQDYPMAILTAEEALKRLGESQGFLYFLGKAQRLGGNTGKSVKTFERLVLQYPDHAEFSRQLAISYLERGYGKKAFTAFAKAYDMGCRDLEFLSLYSQCCLDRADYARGASVLKEVVQTARKQPGTYMCELLDAFSGLFVLSSEAGSEELMQEVMETFLQILPEIRPHIRQYREEAQEMCLYMLMSLSRLLQETDFSADDLTDQIREQLRPLIGKGEDQELYEGIWKTYQQMQEELRVMEDDRLSEVLKRAYEAFVPDPEEDYPPEVIRFIQLDTLLCMLEEWPGLKSQLDLVQKEYPLYYQNLEDPIHTLASAGSLDQLRRRLLKAYDRLSFYEDAGYYYRTYPERRSGQKTVQWNSEDSGTYTRSGRKIGRNDPCPCGSGKKYKNCCGR